MAAHPSVFRAVAAALVLMPGAGQASDVIDGQVGTIPREDAATTGFTRGSFVAAPVPFRNPTIGTGLALGGGFLFKDDAESSTSYIGVGGFRTDNGSQGYGFATSLALDGNRWKGSAFVGQVDLTYDLYTALGLREISQSGALVKVDLAYGFTPALSFGVVGRYLETQISSDGDVPSAVLADLGDASVASFGLTGDFDRRDDTIYPTEGFHLSAVLTHSRFDGILTRDYQKASLLYDIYRPFGGSGVLAARIALCGASEDAPFFDQCSLGGTDALRGFPVTQYLDNRLASAQVAYRHRFTSRLGGVVFAGAGTVGESMDALSLSDAHTAAGLGARIRLSRSFPVDFSIDGTRNDEGEQLLYVYVGQRF